MRLLAHLLRHVRRRLRARWDRYFLSAYASPDPCDGFSCAVCACPTTDPPVPTDPDGDRWCPISE